MNRTAQLGVIGILLTVVGCSKQSQIQPAATNTNPSVVQAAAPVVHTAPVPPPQPVAATAPQSGMLTPHPSAGQRIDEGYLLSSDQNFAVGVQLVTGTGEFFMMKLAIANQTSAPVVFNVSDVSMNAVGREVTVFPRTPVSVMNIPNAADFMKILHSNYWDDSTVLAPNSQEEHILLAACGTGCPTRVAVRVAVGGQSYDFEFGDARNAQSLGSASAAPRAEVLSSASTPEPNGPSVGQIMASLNVDDITDRCGYVKANIGPGIAFVTYSNDFNTGPVVGTQFRSVHIEVGEGIKNAWATPYGSNHEVSVTNLQLAQVMPCLLNGGVAK
jgi:hypothetical protein